MHYFSPLRIVTLLVLTPIYNALLVNNVTSIEQQGTTDLDCTNPDKNLRPACYDALQVDSNISTWWEQNQNDCETNYAGYGFVSCFQQKVGRGELLNQQCNKMGPGQCTRPGNFSHYEPWEYYALSSIFGIWQWFNSIYDASDFADGTASDRVANITATFNPDKPKNPIDLLSVLSAISAGLGLISGPIASSVLVLDSELLVSGYPSFLDAEAAQPTFDNETTGHAVVNDALFAHGSLDDQTLQFDQIEARLGDVVIAFQSNVANALDVLQSNVASFRSFALHGAYIAPDTDLNASTSILTQSLTTYVVSQCLQANEYSIYFTPNTNPYELRTNGSLPSKYNGYVNCQDPPDKYGVCDRWYSNGKGAFSLWGGPNWDNDYFALMETMFSKGWTTGELLFDGALSCWINVTVNGGSPQLGINTTTMRPLCISSVNVLMYTQPTVCIGPSHGCPQTTYQNGTSCFWEWPNDGCGNDGWDYQGECNIIDGACSGQPITDFRLAVKEANGPCNAYLDSLGL